MKKLIVFFGAIGDTILLAPAIQKLSRKADITIIGYPERMALLEKAGWVKKTYNPDEVDFTSLFSSPSEKLKQFLLKFDTVYFFIRNGDILTKNTKTIGIPHIHTFPGIPPNNWDNHASNYYLHCFGLTPDNEFILPIKTQSFHKKIIIHPGSGSPKKNFPLEVFITLTQKIVHRKLPVQWCVGPAEENITFPPNISLLKMEKLTELAKYLAGASAFIGNDNGISHIAGAIGIKTVVLFRTTDPKIWHPLGPHVYTFTPQTLHLGEIENIVCRKT